MCSRIKQQETTNKTAHQIIDKINGINNVLADIKNIFANKIF